MYIALPAGGVFAWSWTVSIIGGSTDKCLPTHGLQKYYSTGPKVMWWRARAIQHPNLNQFVLVWTFITFHLRRRRHNTSSTTGQGPYQVMRKECRDRIKLEKTGRLYTKVGVEHADSQGRNHKNSIDASRGVAIVQMSTGDPGCLLHGPAFFSK